MNSITALILALLGHALALAVVTTVLRRRIAAKPGVATVKVYQDETHARFVRADGRMYSKFYDAYGAGSGSSLPTLLPWGRFSHPTQVAALQN
jgi:hypothetical protein